MIVGRNLLCELKHKVWKNEKFCLTERNSSNQLFSNLSKTIAFTKFLRKKCEREFLQFPHCETERTEPLHFWQNFRENNVFTTNETTTKELIWQNILRWERVHMYVCMKATVSLKYKNLQRVDFTNYFSFFNSTVSQHTAHSVLWKLRKFTLTHFWQKFHENNAFTK